MVSLCTSRRTNATAPGLLAVCRVATSPSHKICWYGKLGKVPWYARTAHLGRRQAASGKQRWKLRPDSTAKTAKIFQERDGWGEQVAGCAAVIGCRIDLPSRHGEALCNSTASAQVLAMTTAFSLPSPFQALPRSPRRHLKSALGSGGFGLGTLAGFALRSLGGLRPFTPRGRIPVLASHVQHTAAAYLCFCPEQGGPGPLVPGSVVLSPCRPSYATRAEAFL